MAFKFKDLLIDVLRAGVHCGPATIEPAGVVHCGPATIEPAAAHCGPATIEPFSPPMVPLALLKRLLQDALAQIEAQERGQQPGDSLPQTRAEADDLESRLKAALAELAEHKKTLGS